MTPEERATEAILVKLRPGDSDGTLDWRASMRPEINKHIAAAVEEERAKIAKLTEIQDAAYELILFIRDKYDVDALEDFKCPHHRRLAKAVYDAR